MRHERGFALALVLVTFMLVSIIGLGALSVVMSDMHGAIANELAMQATSVAEAGLNYAAAQLVTRASAPVPTDERYAGESDDIAVPRSDGSIQGTFRVTVRCAYPQDATPPACQDDVTTSWIDERDERVIVSLGFVAGRPGRARRQLEATVRRYAIGRDDTPVFGVCGRDGVELGPETSVTADVGSNGDVFVDGPRRNPGTVRQRLPRAPESAPTIEAAVPVGAGLTGVYTWRVTFIDISGNESGGSPSSAPSRLVGQDGRLTNIPLGDSAIVRRRIYRSQQGATRGPWFLVAELPDNVTQDYIDFLPDEALRHPLPGGIEGAVTAGGAVSCTRGCGNQVDGEVRASIRAVVCPNFLPPPVQPGAKPAPDPIVQSATTQTVRWGSLHVAEHESLTVQTLSVPDAQLHVHVTDITLDDGAILAVSGPGTVYFHVAGGFVLGRGAVFGAVDFDGRLVKPADRIKVLVHARDPSYLETGVASIRFLGDNRVAAVVFGPTANTTIDQMNAFGGALYGKYVRISRSTGIFTDPAEGVADARSGIRATPYQYVVRWYDNPNPGR